MSQSLDDSPPSSLAAEHFCAKCGTSVEPLRAARARLFADRMRYYCSGICADSFTADDLKREGSTTSKTQSVVPKALRHSPSTRPSATPNQEQSRAPSEAPGKKQHRSSSTPKPRDTAEAARANTLAEDGPPTPIRSQGAGLRAHLPSYAAAAGALNITLLLAQESTLTLYVRAAIAGLGACSLGAYALWRQVFDDDRPRPETWLLALLATLTSFAAIALGSNYAAEATAFAGTLLVSTGGSLALLRSFSAPQDQKRAEIREVLDQPAAHIEGTHLETGLANELSPGIEIVLHAGEVVPADATITAGKAEVYPWPQATLTSNVQQDDNLYAGARLASGQIRATVKWTHHDRQWARLTWDPARRADRHAPLVTLTGKLSTRSSIAIVALAAIAAPFYPQPFELALMALALLGLVTNPAFYGFPALVMMRTVLAALDKGIVFRSASALESAGRISTAVFCARGTLLLGEPEISSLESFGSLTSDDVLALIAGAEQGHSGPISIALTRAIRARSIQADAVRSPMREPGLGTTAIASNGQPLVVGSRALMLNQRISVARAEARITELEALGRSATLVALGGRLVGILALQDGLRAGARAAVQHLLDAGIEPVLISGDSRKTCEALGRTIDIDHVRPEVLPALRGEEISRLQSGGAQVAVIGRTPNDDLALTQAGISIVLPSPGFQASDFDIELAGNEVQKASVALALAQRGRTAAYRALLTQCGAIFAGFVLILALQAPTSLAPIVSLVGTLAAGLVAFGGRKEN